MTHLRGAHLLEALGWTVLNSFWQMALLWCLYSSLCFLFRFSSAAKYRLASGTLIGGFLWAALTFSLYLTGGPGTFIRMAVAYVESSSLLKTLLFSASITYLLLLAFPAYQLFLNWRTVGVLRSSQLQKAPLHYRLFVDKIAAQLGITKKVHIALSNLASAPLTIGYVKPIILLPVAAVNQLTTAQVEAVLVHELAHIRRFDYLYNLVLSVVKTVLYFNPFVHYISRELEAERETSCDELVVQFCYDKVAYASALLHLQKSAVQQPIFSLAATGRHNLASRIEKIVGIAPKKKKTWLQALPVLATLICVVLFNSVLIINDSKKAAALSYSSDVALLPWQIQPITEKKWQQNTAGLKKNVTTQNANTTFQKALSGIQTDDVPYTFISEPAENTQFLPVDFNEVEGSLSQEDKENVAATIKTTKKAAGTVNWNEIETHIGDAMSEQEKAMARQEYLQEIEKVNWQNIEQNLKANYNNLNWKVINENIARVQEQIEGDSLKTIYKMALAELEKLENDIRSKNKTNVSPLPDASLKELHMAKAVLRQNIDSLIEVKPKKIVRF